MKTKIQEILNAPYSRVLIPDNDGFSAEILEFPGCFAQGDTPNEAFTNLEEAAKAWISSSLERGLEIPPPASNIGYSGRIALRIPRSLHKRAAQFAGRDGTSLNQFLISSIAAKVGAEEYNNFLFQKIEKNVFPVVTYQIFVASAGTSGGQLYDVLSNLSVTHASNTAILPAFIIDWKKQNEETIIYG